MSSLVPNSVSLEGMENMPERWNVSRKRVAELGRGPGTLLPNRDTESVPKGMVKRDGV